MKKRLLIAVIMSVMMCGLLTGCNKTIIDTTYSFDKAIIELPDGSVIEDEIQSWTDYEDGDQIQVKLKDGKTYLVHSSKIVLIAE